MGSEQGMAEGEDKVLAKDTGGEEEARGAPGAPVSAGPCSLLAWPLGNLASLLTGVPHLPDGTHFRPPPAKPFGEPLDHVRTVLDPSGASSLHTWPFSTSTEAPMGMVTLHLVLPPPYPGWIWPLLLRNMAAAWAICGFWDWLMYLSPLAPRFKPFKIYPKLPTLSQVRHDAFWTSIGMVCATLLEASYCWGVANHKIPAAATLAEAPFTHLVWILLMTHLGNPMTTFDIALSTHGGSTGCLDLIRVDSCTSTSTSCTTRATTQQPSPAPASTPLRTSSSSPLASLQCPSGSTLSSSSPSWWTVALLLGLDMVALSSQAPATITTIFTTPTLIATMGPRTLG